MNNTLKNRRNICKILAVTGLAGVSAPALARAAARAASGDSGEAGKGALEVMHARRSYRAFSGASVPEEDLRKILAAGMNAPSANNSQPWDFVIVRAEAAKQAIINFVPAFGFTKTASALVFACVDKDKAPGEGYVLAQISVACACLNMWLAAEALGYGAAWLSITPLEGRMNFFHKMLKLPDNREALCLMPIGVPQAKIAPETRFMASKVHFESW